MTFIHDDFLLDTAQAKVLYHDYAKDMPIVDYHCHLPPEQVAENRQFRNLTEVWLAGDHYKWRAMRSNGINERFITGDASDREKFDHWCATVPYTLRNPLYHWTHLELRRPFGINDRLLDSSSAQYVWDHCNELLKTPAFTARGLMLQAKVKMVGTTDDPVDDLAAHKITAADKNFACAMLPSWRPDNTMAVDNPEFYNRYLDKLSVVADVQITRFDDLLKALQIRHDYFHANGCRLSDHGLETVPGADFTREEIESIFNRVRSGKSITAIEVEQFQNCMLIELAIMDHAKGWAQQFHIGAIRNNNPRLFRQIGPNTGFDSIGDHNYAKPLAKFLGRLDDNNQLAKTILYNLNPRDNEMIGTMIGNFQDGSTPGKIQFGSGWWFLDQMDGMTKQIDALSQLGLLSRFIGMLTDSRSFLSYSRHDYFRRILCGMLGRDMAKGILPNDSKMLGKLVQDISFNNAKNYFSFVLPE
jgi:glucuronate isomerase